MEVDRARNAIELILIVTLGAGIAGFFWNLGKMYALSLFMKIEQKHKQ